MPECEEFNNSVQCLYYGCYWWDHACHSEPQPDIPPPSPPPTPPPAPPPPPPEVDCEDHTTEDECLAAGCYWYDNSCHSEPEDEMTIEEIDMFLAKRINDMLRNIGVEIDSYFITEYVARTYVVMRLVDEEVTEIRNFLTKDMKTSLTGMVDAFGTPEALIGFLLDVEPGEEGDMLDLMQILIAMTFERGLTE